MAAALARVVEIASEISGKPIEWLTPQSAIDQDLGVSGDDVEDLAEALAAEFGEDVWHWPWQRFACLDEGVSLLFPLILLWQLISWPFRGTFSYPSHYERLELGHIAAVIENGSWFDP